MKIFLFLLIITFLNSCATYSHKSGNNSNLHTDSKFCQLTANTQAPTYICRGITFCAPDETAIALQALAQNNAVYEKCMMSKGYVPQ